MKHLELLGEAPVFILCSLMLRDRERAHLLFSETESTLSLCGFIPNPQKLVSLVLSQSFDRIGTESLRNGANNYTLVWTKKGTKSFWKTHQPCPQHPRQHQALGKSYKRKPQLNWRLAGMEGGPSGLSERRPAKHWAAACLPPSRKAALAKRSCQVWLTSTNLGLARGHLQLQYLLSQHTSGAAEGQRIGQGDTENAGLMKWWIVLPPSRYFEVLVIWKRRQNCSSSGEVKEELGVERSWLGMRRVRRLCWTLCMAVRRCWSAVPNHGMTETQC